jgi:NitT/TauT family transport system substrate-binding protein
MRSNKLFLLLIVTAVSLSIFLTGCGGSSSASGNTDTIRVGYFPNITHSQALVGMSRGDFAQAMGNVKIDAKVFNAGPSEMEALLAGQLDLGYVGPSPAINSYTRSDGALRIIAGATSGGAVFVVRPESGIKGPADLAGKKICTPQLGNTQDVALRNWLAKNGLKTKDKGGTVEVIPTENSTILTLFTKGDIDGAWVPEPWGARLVGAGGQILLDERDLWPDGQFTTAVLVARKDFMDKNPELVKKWLATHVDITTWEQKNPDQAATVINSELKTLAGKPLPEDVLKSALSRMSITYDPVTTSIPVMAKSAFDLGFLGNNQPDLTNLVDLKLLNEVLSEKGLAAVK